ncbi:VOC family protein [Anaerobiospirillum succiniciproducens]|uniref:VOC family protein n=1 Tax=Anaerobiospirillum succiniciproducens TaxID=13335 RepID=UPI002352660D|nr:VOC family protein [Anaerobiospirillum succiniciproducens]MCI6863378.1 VOC family protein [Anaerobiospirillum succiniciproducens]
MSQFEVLMQITAHFDHFNINVTNLERSIAFYKEALGLVEVRRKEAADGSYILVYLGDNTTPFSLELTWLRDHTNPYELGDNESHMCLRVKEDYDEVRAFHKQMGCVCYENEVMGLYFIHDPDDYWIEILPVKKDK